MQRTFPRGWENLRFHRVHLCACDRESRKARAKFFERKASNNFRFVNSSKIGNFHLTLTSLETSGMWKLVVFKGVCLCGIVNVLLHKVKVKMI